MQVMTEIVRKHPVTTAIIPLAVFLVLAGLGVFGVLAGAQSVATNNQNVAYSVAVDTSYRFSLSIQTVSTCSPL